MAERSIFFDEWVQCLREQYIYVIRNKDEVTRESLTGVLYSLGFTDDELAQLRVRATMHVDDMPDDFVPDMDVLNTDTPKAEPAFTPHPAECTCPQCMEIIDESKFDRDGQPLENPPEVGEAGHVFAAAQIEIEPPEIESPEPLPELEDADSNEGDIQEEEVPEAEDDAKDGPTQLSMF